VKGVLGGGEKAIDSLPSWKSKMTTSSNTLAGEKEGGFKTLGGSRNHTVSFPGEGKGEGKKEPYDVFVMQIFSGIMKIARLQRTPRGEETKRGSVCRVRGGMALKEKTRRFRTWEFTYWRRQFSGGYDLGELLKMRKDTLTYKRSIVMPQSASSLPWMNGDGSVLASRTRGEGKQEEGETEKRKLISDINSASSLNAGQTIGLIQKIVLRKKGVAAGFTRRINKI